MSYDHLRSTGAVPAVFGMLRTAVDAMDQARAADVGCLTVEQIVSVSRLTQQVSRTAAALLLEVAALADESDVAKSQGAASTADWIAKNTGTTKRDAARDLSLARGLKSSAPQTRSSMSEVGMSKDKAHLIAAAMVRLPREVSAVERQRVEADLIVKAKKFSVEDPRLACRRSLDIVDKLL